MPCDPHGAIEELKYFKSRVESNWAQFQEDEDYWLQLGDDVFPPVVEALSAAIERLELE